MTIITTIIRPNTTERRTKAQHSFNVILHCVTSHFTYYKLKPVVYQPKADHPRTAYTDKLFCSCDLDLDLMTLMYESDLKKLSRSRLSKVGALQTDK